MNTKVAYLYEMHKVFLLHADGMDFFTVMVLLEAYMQRYNIRYQDLPECAANFLKNGHDTIYYDFQHFCTLCETYLDFGDTGTLFERVCKHLCEQDRALFPHLIKIAS